MENSLNQNLHTRGLVYLLLIHMATLSMPLKFSGHQLPICKLKIICNIHIISKTLHFLVFLNYEFIKLLLYIHQLGNPEERSYKEQFVFHVLLYTYFLQLLIHNANFLELRTQKFTNHKQNLAVAEFGISRNVRGKKERGNDGSSQQFRSYRKMIQIYIT